MPYLSPIGPSTATFPSSWIGKEKQGRPSTQAPSQLENNSSLQELIFKRQRRALPDSISIIANTLPDRIAHLDATIFRRITRSELQQLTMEQVEHLTPQQVTAVPIEILTSLSPRQISSLNPLVFRDLSAAYFNHLLITDDGAACIGAIRPEQIHEIQSWKDVIRGVFILLEPSQIAALSEKQIMSIDPEIFRNTSLTDFLSLLKKSQLQALVADQIRTIPPKNVRQLCSNYFLNNRDLFGELLPVQRRWLTEEQLAVITSLNERNVVVSYAVDRFHSMSKAEVQMLARQEIQMLSPEMLQRLGVQFLRNLAAEQLDWLTEKQRRVFASGDLSVIRQAALEKGGLLQEKLRSVKRLYISRLTPQEISEKAPTFFEKLQDTDIAVLSPNQLEQMLPDQISYQRARFFRSLNARQFMAFSKTQRQAIAPVVFSELSVADFWGRLLPLQPRLASLDPQNQLHLSPVQFRTILQDLTPEQASRIPIVVYQSMGDDFVSGLDASALHKIPDAVFQYSTPKLLQTLSQSQLFALTPRQVVNLKLKTFSAFTPENIIWVNPEVFAALTQRHVEAFSTAILSVLQPLQVARLKPEVFVRISAPDLAHITPKAFRILSPEHLSALAKRPGKRSIKNQMLSHPVQWLTERQLRKIPRENIGQISSEFFEKLDPKQFDFFRKVQLREIPIQYIRAWKLENNRAYQKLLEKKDLLYSNQQDVINPPSDLESGHIDGSRATTQPLLSKRSRVATRRAVVLFAPLFALQSQEPTQLRKAVGYLRARYPESDFYALGLDERGRWSEWGFVPSGEWTWQTIRRAPTGEYDNVILLGHGAEQVESAQFGSVVDQFFQWAKNVSRIQHLSILACGIRVELGMMFGPTRVNRRDAGIQIDRITGSELPLYIGGPRPDGKPASRLYQDKADGKIKHGVGEGKWEIRRDEDGQWKVTGYLLPTNGDGEIFEDPTTYAGPFGYAERLQTWNKAKNSLKRASEVLRNISRDAEEKAARLAQEPNSSEFVALLEGVTEDVKSGQYLLPVVNMREGSLQKVEIPAERVVALRTAQQEVKPAYRALKPYLQKKPDDSLEVVEGGLESTGSMNSAFLIMAFLEYIKSAKLSSSEKLSVYWNLSAMGAAVAADGIELGKIVTQLMAPMGAIERSLGALGRIFGPANAAFMAGTVFLDIYELAISQDDVKRVGTEIGLGFNLAALGMQAGAAGISYFLPSVAATAGGIGSLSIPLVGLGFGFSVLGSQIASHNEEVHHFYKFFIEYFRSCDSGVYTKHKDILIPTGNVPIAEINYRTRKITLGEVRLRKSREAGGGWIQKLAGAAPDLIYPPEYFEILEPEEKTFPLDTSVSTILLSKEAPVDIDYNYIYSAASKDDGERDVDNRLRKRGEFEPSNSWGNLKPEIKLRYRNGVQRVVLDAKARVLWFPPENKGSHIAGRMDFEIEGLGSQYMLRNIRSGFTLRDMDGIPAKYVLEFPEADLLSEDDVRVKSDGKSTVLLIKQKGNSLCEINMTHLQSESQLILIGKGGLVTREVNMKAQKSAIVALDLRSPRSWDAESLLHTLSDSGQLPDYVAIIQGSPLPEPLQDDAKGPEKDRYEAELNEADRAAIHILWDTKNRRIIAPSEDYPPLKVIQAQGSQLLGPWLGTRLVGLTNQHAFFYQSEKKILTQINCLTNKWVTSYGMQLGEDDSTVERVFAIKDPKKREEQIIVKQRVPYGSPRKEAVLFYALRGEGLELFQVGGLDLATFRKLETFSNDFLTDIRSVRLDGSPSLEKENLMAIFLRQLPFKTEEIPFPSDLENVKLSEWIKILGPQKTPGALFVNVGNAYRMPGTEEETIVTGGWYPSETGGGWLILWEGKTKKARFAKLDPGYFKPVVLLSEQESRRMSGSIHPQTHFHLLAEGKEVLPFQESESVYLVAEDGRKIYEVDSYGFQTSFQVDAEPLSETDFDDWYETDDSPDVAETPTNQRSLAISSV